MIGKLKRNSDFKRVYSKGKSYGSRLTILYKFPRNSDKIRFGYSVSKKVGKAVVRNRVKRRLKEAVGLFSNKLKPGFDIVIIPRASITRADFNDIKKDIENIFKKTGLIN